MKQKPSFNEEKLLLKSGYHSIAGIDEVGRGAFAGPLVTAAVIFQDNYSFRDPDLYTINDSKVLSPRQRENLSEKIKKEALCYSIAEIPVNYINHYGIGKAAQLGFYKAAQTLCHQPDFCLIDAFPISRLKKSIQKAIIHGDSISYSIAAASIIAKVYRDSLMRKIHCDYREYDFATNKGYGTLKHRQQIKKHGLSPVHRTSFSLNKFL
ncbi:MAG: ribonuclease HII [Patescibacteria group bacterium]